MFNERILTIMCYCILPFPILSGNYVVPLRCSSLLMNLFSLFTEYQGSPEEVCRQKCKEAAKVNYLMKERKCFFVMPS